MFFYATRVAGDWLGIGSESRFRDEAFLFFSHFASSSEYSPGKAPADLASACLELAAWNMTRYRGPPSRQRVLIGMTGNVRGTGKDGEHIEPSMPENVQGLLEPYWRRTIWLHFMKLTMPYWKP
jgi:hypothetical protein